MSEGLARARRDARPHGGSEDCCRRPPTWTGFRVRRRRSRRSRTRTSCASSTTARTRPARSWRSSGCRTGRSRNASPGGRCRRRENASRGGRDRSGARPSALARPRAPRPQAGERPLRRGGAARSSATSALPRRGGRRRQPSPTRGRFWALPRNISPEQAAGEPASPASDPVNSFGVHPLPDADGRAAVRGGRRRSRSWTCTAARRRLRSRTLQPDAPPEPRRAGPRQALRKDPAERPADGEALLAALGASAATVPVTADTARTQVLAAPPAPAPARPRRQDQSPDGSHRHRARPARSVGRPPRLGGDATVLAGARRCLDRLGPGDGDDACAHGDCDPAADYDRSAAVNAADDETADEHRSDDHGADPSTTIPTENPAPDDAADYDPADDVPPATTGATGTVSQSVDGSLTIGNVGVAAAPRCELRRRERRREVEIRSAGERALHEQPPGRSPAGSGLTTAAPCTSSIGIFRPGIAHPDSGLERRRVAAEPRVGGRCRSSPSFRRRPVRRDELRLRCRGACSARARGSRSPQPSRARRRSRLRPVHPESTLPPEKTTLRMASGPRVDPARGERRVHGGHVERSHRAGAEGQRRRGLELGPDAELLRHGRNRLRADVEREPGVHGVVRSDRRRGDRLGPGVRAVVRPDAPAERRVVERRREGSASPRGSCPPRRPRRGRSA